jgi:molybdopterin-guanine dinucleotide biosynthesis protein A
VSTPAAPVLVGLVLAGGQSRRMRQDKGTLDYHGVSQAEYCHALLSRFCAEVVVSVNVSQSEREPYRRLPLLVDSGSVAGPAAGLLSAWAVHPDAALLTLAVDLPLVDDVLLTSLVSHRNPARAATAWVHPDGVLEPLCAIWEPGLRDSLIAATHGGSPSVRRLLELADVERLEPSDPRQIASVNNEDDYRQVLTALGRTRVNCNETPVEVQATDGGANGATG